MSLLYRYDCQGYADSGEETGTEGKNDESTAADPAPADVQSAKTTKKIVKMVKN